MGKSYSIGSDKLCLCVGGESSLSLLVSAQHLYINSADFRIVDDFIHYQYSN